MEKGQRLTAANGACSQRIQGEMLHNYCHLPDMHGTYLCLDSMDWTYLGFRDEVKDTKSLTLHHEHPNQGDLI